MLASGCVYKEFRKEVETVLSIKAILPGEGPGMLTRTHTLLPWHPAPALGQG